MLNAFRHLGSEQERQGLQQAVADAVVLNAFRHLGSEQVADDLTLAAHVLVLNAFRDLGSEQGDGDGGSRVQEQACSTSFGIYDRSSGNPFRSVTFDSTCSTPFGICDRSRLHLSPDWGRAPRVLNAFRHLGSDAEQDREAFKSEVDVLNAFRHLGSEQSHNLPAR